MDCRDTKLLIDAWWDGHLPEELADGLERHMERCPVCQAEYGPVNRLLADPEPVEVPAGLRDRIMAAVEQEPLPEAGGAGFETRLRWWAEVMRAPWAGAVAACLVFVLLGWVSSRIPTGGHESARSGVTHGERPACVVSNPLLVASLPQRLAVPGPGGALAMVAQTAALEKLTEAPAAAPAIHDRDRLWTNSQPPQDCTAPAIPEIPMIVVGLSTVGA